MKEDGTEVSLLRKAWPYQTELFRVCSGKKEARLQTEGEKE